VTRVGDLAETVSAVAGTGRVLSVHPGGNHGDSLIYHGAERLFADHDIDPVQLRAGRFRHDAPPRYRVRGAKDLYNLFDEASILRELAYLRHRVATDVGAVYIHGGGNFNDYWGSGIRCFRAAVRHFDCPIVVGPQSVQFSTTDPRTVFAGVTNEVRFFCRERYSQDLIATATADHPTVTTHLADDTALYLTVEDLPVEAVTEEYSLVALRGDKESATTLLEDRIDPPIFVRDISVAEPSYEAFVRAAARASTIYTDRLHGAILGTILGKPVRFYGNAYHKNRGVYEYSLADVETTTFTPANGSTDGADG